MNLEKAIEVLNEWIRIDRMTRKGEEHSDYDDFCEEKCIAIDVVLSELEQTKADLYSANCVIGDLVSNKVEWISVNDKIPEEETKVLVCRNYEDIEVGYVYGDDWFTWENNEIINFATHWAELPELPKEEE